jgi:DNA-binding beta-propeller fold protein YncE
MARHKLHCLFVGTALLAIPTFLSGKAETIRVTITGGGLTHPIQITDAKIVNVSHAWGAEFLDSSRPPLTQAPNITSPYEVAFYSRIANNDIRKTCVFFYSPRTSAAGVIYLPGKGAIWGLNVGTIIREGRDGKWSYASPAWEAMIKPLIARAEAGRGLSAASTSEIVVDQWRKPLPGWLYVLDPRSDPTGPASRVLLVDPEKSTIMGSIRAGYDPDFALSPDGAHLYIASGEREWGELAAVDTATGNIRHIAFPDRVLYKPWYQGLPPYSGMAITADGRALWIPVPRVPSPDRIETRLSVFDTQSVRFLKTAVDPGHCDTGDFVASSAADHLDFLCGSSAKPNSVRLVRLDAMRDEMFSVAVDLPLSIGCGLAELLPLPGRNTMAIIRTDGAIYQMDTATWKSSPASLTGACRDWNVADAEWPRSADGTRLYLGYGGVVPNGMSAAKALRLIDTARWVETKRIQTSVPFWSAVVSQDGKYVFAISPESHGIVILDAHSLQEIRVIAIGNTPSLAIVAPGFAARNHKREQKSFWYFRLILACPRAHEQGLRDALKID